MAVIKNILFSMLAVTVVAACAYRWDIDGVRNLESHGAPFDKALKEGFTDFAEVEAMRGDWVETERYLIRARAAAEGKTVDPYYFYLRSVPVQVIEQVNYSYGRLLHALENNARVDMPEEAAAAQMGYECWIEALEENLFVDRMEACKTQFDIAMEVLEGKAPNMEEAFNEYQMMIAQAANPEPIEGSVADASEIQSHYAVYFDFNKTSIKPEYNDVISKAGLAYMQIDPQVVVVSGHADTVGTDKVNMIVSRKRADNVSKALNEVGVPKEKMDVRAFGEKMLAVQTADNVREPRNRRVEIDLNK